MVDFDCAISLPSGGVGSRDWCPRCASGGRIQLPDASPAPPRVDEDRDARGSDCRYRNESIALYRRLFIVLSEYRKSSTTAFMSSHGSGIVAKNPYFEGSLAAREAPYSLIWQANLMAAVL